MNILRFNDFIIESDGGDGGAVGGIDAIAPNPSNVIGALNGSDYFDNGGTVGTYPTYNNGRTTFVSTLMNLGKEKKSKKANKKANNKKSDNKKSKIIKFQDFDINKLNIPTLVNELK